MTDTIPATPDAALAAALAAFQAELPRLGKASRADAGTYSYNYAGLADVAAAALPALGRHGLSFSAKPTLNADGRFVLEYTLRHAAGGSDTGAYPLPTSGTPQQVGSAITYARRYCLLAVTGIAPDEDDDGKEAGHATYSYDRAPAAPREPTAAELVVQARGRLAARCAESNWDRDIVAALYVDKAKHPLQEATDAARIDKFREYLSSLPDHELKPAAANGAQA